MHEKEQLPGSVFFFFFFIRCPRPSAPKALNGGWEGSRPASAAIRDGAPPPTPFLGGERLLPLPRGGPLGQGFKGQGPGTGRTRQWAGLRVGFHPCLLPP